MLLLKFLKLIVEKESYEVGKSIYQSGGIISYHEKKELEDVFEVEAKVQKDGKTHTINLFINHENEYFSQFNCNCYYYSVCSHTVAVVFKFFEHHKHDIIRIDDIPQKYIYEIYQKEDIYFIKANYDSEIMKWIKEEIVYSDSIKTILECLSYDERAIIYELKLNGSNRLNNNIAKSAAKLKVLNHKLNLKNPKYSLEIVNNIIHVSIKEKPKIKVKSGILDYPLEDKRIEYYNNREVTPEFLFEILPLIKKEIDVELNKEIEQYVLEERIAKYILKFEEHDKKIVIIPEILIEGKTYRNLEILTVDLKYKKIEEKHWKKTDEAKHKKFIAFLKNKNLKATKSGFMCSQDFFDHEYKTIPSEWKKVGIKNINVRGEANIDFRGKKGKLEIQYNINDKTLSDEELKDIIDEGFIKKGNNLYFVENRKELVTNTKFEDKKENLLCYLESIKEIKSLHIKNKIVEEMVIPEKFSPILRNYQRDGFKWMNFLYKFKFGGILADDMGLGKTVQTLALIESIESEGVILIVAPKSLLFNWKDEIVKFLQTDDYMIYDGEKNKREKIFNDIQKKRIVVTSFSILKQDFELIKEIEFLYVILDEAQNIKNYETVIWKHISGLNTKNRLALTGTPIENSLKELWAIFEFIMPGYLGKYDAFLSKGGIEEIKYRTMPFILRRTKQEVLKELPDKIEQVVRVEMYPQQKVLYDSILEEMKRKIDEEINKVGIKKSYFTILSALTYLREVCNHPELVGKKGIYSAKVDLFEEIVDEAIEGGHKILVFSQFVKMLDILKRSLEAKEIKYEILTGETKDRMEVVHRFNNDDNIKVFLISLKAGGVGLNLTSADTVIHIDPWWNPMVEKQATDRAHRIGQTKKLNVYKIITKETIEEKIIEIQNKKKEIFDMLINSNSEYIKDITVEDLKKLFE